MALCVAERRQVRCDYAKFILENLIEANLKNSSKNKLYMSAGPMLTRIAYQALGMIEDLPATSSQASLIQQTNYVPKAVKITSSASSSRTTRSTKKSSSDEDRTDTDKDQDSNESDHEDNPKGVEAPGPFEYEQSDKEDTSTSLDKKSKKARTRDQILMDEAMARVEARRKELANARAAEAAKTAKPTTMEEAKKLRIEKAKALQEERKRLEAERKAQEEAAAAQAAQVKEKEVIDLSSTIEYLKKVEREKHAEEQRVAQLAREKIKEALSRKAEGPILEPSQGNPKRPRQEDEEELEHIQADPPPSSPIHVLLLGVEPNSLPDEFEYCRPRTAANIGAATLLPCFEGKSSFNHCTKFYEKQKRRVADSATDSMVSFKLACRALAILCFTYAGFLWVAHRSLYGTHVTPLPYNASLDKFSEGRTMKHIWHLADDIGIRQEGSIGLIEAANYLRLELESYKQRASLNVRVEIDQTFVYGSFNMIFLKHSICLAYKNHTNIAIRKASRVSRRTSTPKSNSCEVEVFTRRWMPQSGLVKAIVFICHGYGDTYTRFFERVARMLAKSGYAVFLMDYPGFGLSSGLHSYVPSFNRLVKDVIKNYCNIKGQPEFKKLPCFLLGESMGGAVVLKSHLK
ncbi:hypothetical protein L7F22_008174 [Adiantum nelumboides]|nr:hypothetical protein [Adiantum nelumboides]